MKAMIKMGKVLLGIAVLSLTTIVTNAREDRSPQPRNSNPSMVRNRVASDCDQATARTNLDINNVRTLILNGGDMWWDQGSSDQARYEIPKNDDPAAPKKHSLFAGSVWVGGKDAGGTLKVAAQTYRQSTVLGVGFWPGPLSEIDATTSKAECVRWDRQWKVSRKEIQDHILATQAQDPNYVMPAAIRDWPVSGDVSIGQDDQLAPYIDANGNGTYDPALGDYPDVFGDQSIWWVFNDRGGVGLGGTIAIGMEIQTQAFAYQSNDELNNMTFYTNKIINRSSTILTETYMAQWVDPDLGNALDDYVGCDVPRGLGICYNGDEDDEGIIGYGQNPPSVGVDFFEGPFSDPDDGIDNDRDGNVDELEPFGCDPDPAVERIIMAKFLYFNNDQTVIGNPTTAEHAYNYMIGRWKDNTPMVYGGNGYPGSGGATNIPTTIMFPGSSDPIGWGIGGTPSNPIAPPFEWSERNPGPGATPNVPGDRRFVQSAGAFTLNGGDFNFITIGVVWARATSGGATGSFNLLLRADSKAQTLFENCFKTLDGPDAPDVDIVELDQELILNLTYRVGSNNFGLKYTEFDPIIAAQNQNLPPGTPLFDTLYRFEGFKIFQLASSDVSLGELNDLNRARLVYQGDLNNNISQIINWDYDADMDKDVPFIAVAGANQGVRMSIRLTRDLFAEGSDQLVNFKRYYYTVVAYGYNNYAEFDPVTKAGQTKPYLEGRNNVKTYTAIPHKWEPTFNGLILNSQFGDIPEITRLEGQGNGGNVLRLSQASVNEILANGFAPQLTYEKGFGPLSIIVNDPTSIPQGEILLGIYTGSPSSTAEITDNSRWYAVFEGDTIFSDTTIAIGSEQILGYYESSVVFRKLGFSAIIRNAANSGELPEDGNGVLESSIVFPNAQNQWISFLPDFDGPQQTDWIQSGRPVDGPTNVIPRGDENKAFQNIVSTTFSVDGVTLPRGGTFSPMRYAQASAIHPGLFNSPVNTTGAQLVSLRESWYAINNLNSIQLVLTPDKSKWTRSVVIESGETNTLNQGTQRRNAIRIAPSVNKEGQPDGDARNGLGWFPGYAINLETGERLNIAFAEDSRLASQNGRDMLWNPTDSFAVTGAGGADEIVMGGKHFIYILRSRYDEADLPWRQLNNMIDNPNPVNNPINTAIRAFWASVMYTSIPFKTPGREFLSTDVTINIGMSRRYLKFQTLGAGSAATPLYRINTSSLAPIKNDVATAKSALDLIRVVPNPYYAASNYEVSQIDNRVKVTNLPQSCTIRIYTMSGTLVRTLRKDDALTFVDWDLLNQERIPVSSGMYIIHVDAGSLGEKVVKWFGVMRPIDLDTF
jgi:hypothetical protein